MASRDGYRIVRTGGVTELRRFSLGRTLLGLIVCSLAAAFFWAAQAGHMRLSNGAPMPAAAVLGVTAGFAALGVPLLLYRSGVRFEPLRNRIETWWGMPSPLSRREFKLQPFTHVDVRKVVRSNGNNGSSTSYPVRLVGDEPLVLSSMQGPLAARRFAEHIARACNLSMHNEIAGEVVVRAPDELDLPLSERLRRADRVPFLEDRPVLTRLEVDVRGGEVVVKIPAPGMMRGGVALLALTMPGIVFGFAFVGFAAGSVPGWFIGVSVAMGAVPVLLLAGISARRGLRATEVTVRPQALCVRSLWPWGASEWARTGDRIEEITSTASGGGHPLLGSLLPRGKVTVFTDDSLCELGLGLDDGDLSYLRRLIEAGLCGPPDRAEDGPDRENAPPVSDAASLQRN